MARGGCVIGVTHNPFHHRLIRQPREQWNPDTVTMVDRSKLMQQKPSKANPQSLIVVGGDEHGKPKARDGDVSKHTCLSQPPIERIRLPFAARLESAGPRVPKAS